MCVGAGLDDPEVDATRVDLPVPFGGDDYEFPAGEFWNSVSLPEILYGLADPANPSVSLDLRALWHPGCFPVDAEAQPHPCRVSEYPAGCEPTVATALDSITIRDPAAPRPPVATMLVLDRTTANQDTYFADIQRAAPVLLAGMSDSDYVGVVLYSEDAMALSPPVEAGLPVNIGVVEDARDVLAQAIAGANPFATGAAIGDGMIHGQYMLLSRASTGGGVGGLCTTACLPADTRHRMLVVAAHDNSEDLSTKAYLVVDGNQGQIDTGPPHNWPGAPVELNYVERRQSALRVPTIDTISLGPGGAVADMQRAAQVGEGNFMYLDETGFQPLAGPVPRALAAAAQFRAAMDRADEYEAAFEDATWGFGPGYLPWFQVNPGARQMRFILFAADAGSRLDETALVDPSGNPVFPSWTGDHWAQFVIDAPPAGMWQATWLGDPEDPPVNQRVYYAMSERHPVGLRFDARSLAADGSTTGERRAGDLIVVRATLGEAGLSGWPMVAVDVARPDGTADHVYLSDGGYGDDPAAGDGVFQGIYRNASTPGTYTFHVRATMFSPTWGMIQRTASQAMYLPAGVDSDNDSLPDWWETWRGTQLSVGDATADPDGDGLYNLQEYQAGTDPSLDDSDGGGETDASEIGAYRNPLDSTDDGIEVAAMRACSGTDGVHLRFVAVESTARVQVERQLADGPIETLHDGAMPQGNVIFDQPPLGLVACYRSRVRAPSWWTESVSTWSQWGCARRAADPVPPVLDVAVVDGTRSPSRFVDLTIEASDEVEATITSSECASDLAGTEPSGVTMMAVMPTPDPVGLPSSAWTPFQARATLRLDDLHAATGAAGAEEASLWLVVRDTSGNVSAPAYLVMTRPSRSALDRGIRALDDLLDAAATASAGPGASALAECGAELQAALDVLQTDPDGAPGAEAVEDGLGALADISAALSGQDWSAVAAQADQVRRQMLGTWRGYDALLPDAL